jgi:hypothetical protein
MQTDDAVAQNPLWHEPGRRTAVCGHVMRDRNQFVVFSSPSFEAPASQRVMVHSTSLQTSASALLIRTLGCKSISPFSLFFRRRRRS